jgi:A/G-specific adenine glycosylase
MDFYHKAGREHLPWRRAGITAYEVWVSEVMLQQTQVSRVIEYYTKFLTRFPTVAHLAKASWEAFLPYYAGLGYYRRGRNMLLTAQKVMDEFDGEFPRDKKLLLTLPGVGDYTASAILSFAYGDNHLAWDTNLKRVIGRFFYGDKDGDKILRQIRDGDETVFHVHAKELNAALMDFGSAICLGRPKCKVCPLSKQCVYFIQEGMRERKTTINSHSERSEGSRENDARRGFATPSSGLQSKHKVQVTNLNLRDDNASAQDNETRKTDWKNAQVYLWLHENHKLYYSSHPKQFEVFVLSKAYNSRSGIKAYFKDNYGLDLAVRPPHAKRVIAGKPTLYMNAQILLGDPAFVTFSKEEVKAYNENKDEVWI